MLLLLLWSPSELYHSPPRSGRRNKFLKNNPSNIPSHSCLFKIEPSKSFSPYSYKNTYSSNKHILNTHRMALCGATWAYKDVEDTWLLPLQSLRSRKGPSAQITIKQGGKRASTTRKRRMKYPVCSEEVSGWGPQDGSTGAKEGQLGLQQIRNK